MLIVLGRSLSPEVRIRDFVLMLERLSNYL